MTLPSVTENPDQHGVEAIFMGPFLSVEVIKGFLENSSQNKDYVIQII